jgi:hypothetical protein
MEIVNLGGTPLVIEKNLYKCKHTHTYEISEMDKQFLPENLKEKCYLGDQCTENIIILKWILHE